MYIYVEYIYIYTEVYSQVYMCINHKYYVRSRLQQCVLLIFQAFFT